jgi:hypothetical protein
VDFPRSWRAADQDQADARALQVSQAERVQAPRLEPGVLVALRAAQTGDLRPHVSPIRDVVVGQRRRVRLAERARPDLEHAPPEGLGSVRLDVHAEECGVGEHVGVAQPIVERKAVKEARAVGEAEDVVAQQVAVAVADPALVDALRQQPAPALEVAHRQLGDPATLPGRQEVPSHIVDLGQALAPVGDHARRLAGARDLR